MNLVFHKFSGQSHQLGMPNESLKSILDIFQLLFVSVNYKDLLWLNHLEVHIVNISSGN